jgi:hypothetical protein
MGIDYKIHACRRQAKALARTTESLTRAVDGYKGRIEVSPVEMKALAAYASPSMTQEQRELVDAVFRRAIGSGLGGLMLPKVGLVCKLRAKCYVAPNPVSGKEPLSEPRC